MKRYFCLALLTAFLLICVTGPAIAESTEITIDVPEASSETELFDLDLPDLDIDDNLLLDDLVLESPDLPVADTIESTDGEDAAAASDDIQSNAKKSYALNASSITIGVKEEYENLTVNSVSESGSLPKITWRSANKKIAKVDSSTGMITGVKKGSTTVYAKVKGVKKELKCKVTVLKAPTKNKFSVSPENGSLKVGQTGQYTVKFSKGYGGSVYYESSNNRIATVDELGVVTAVAVGKCEITVTTYNGISKTVSLQVLKNSSSENSKITKLLKAARKKLGKPYVHGSNGPDEFDCVGFTYWCYKQVGVKLKSTPTKQANDSRFTKVGYDDLQPGDLLYFHTDDDSTISHAGLYLGDGELIHASSTAGEVIISQMETSKSDYYRRNFAWGRRVFD